MLSKGSRRLDDDHSALDKLLKRLHAVLDNGEVAAIYTWLDLFWAKLAVHIRAEHLHLFPEVLNGITRTAIEQPTLAEARHAIDGLRADHDFFMHELANAIARIRALLNSSEAAAIDDGLKAVRNTICEIEQKLATHNQIEETQVYHWATIALNTDEQTELARRIDGELEKRPQRFEANVW